MMKKKMEKEKASWLLDIKSMVLIQPCALHAPHSVSFHTQRAHVDHQNLVSQDETKWLLYKLYIAISVWRQVSSGTI